MHKLMISLCLFLAFTGCGGLEPGYNPPAPGGDLKTGTTGTGRLRTSTLTVEDLTVPNLLLWDTQLNDWCLWSSPQQDNVMYCVTFLGAMQELPLSSYASARPVLN